MDHELLIDDYLAGPPKLRALVAGMAKDEVDAVPIPAKWSIRQVICHIADFEPIYVDRMKRALAEEQPTVFGGDPDKFAAALAYDHREMEEELQLVETVRRHMARILRRLKPVDFQRKVIHSVDGPLTLATLLDRITGHIPHHVKFIVEKRAALEAG